MRGLARLRAAAATASYRRSYPRPSPCASSSRSSGITLSVWPSGSLEYPFLTVRATRKRRALPQGKKRGTVAVVGGGIAGCGAAWMLACDGFDVVSARPNVERADR